MPRGARSRGAFAGGQPRWTVVVCALVFSKQSEKGWDLNVHVDSKWAETWGADAA